MTTYRITINTHHTDDDLGLDAVEHAALQAAERIGSDGSYGHDVIIVAEREDSTGTIEVARYTLEPGE